MEESIQGFLHTSLPRNVKTDVTAILKDAECQNDAARYWNRSGKADGYVEDIPAFKNDLYDGKGISYWNSGPEDNRMLVWHQRPKRGNYHGDLRSLLRGSRNSIE